ncbi:hypothetical protein E3Q22_02779 [Wallemia mellicola]|uniref:Peptidase M20 dimerisation domain-containing protein n=1 Tax=Wallemia mellicola TaxID=1708541 RepID=A0A4T0M5Q7_9BASI|nr:hypothetical protein E3Q22_02779 [Wallemia mellicola]TIC01666.1 hypothetical protein E3Q17_01779 [Wallemia mellicola]TIC42468.1 hypothetical protein E3Q08_02807 [Wallemia mellicola]
MFCISKRRKERLEERIKEEREESCVHFVDLERSDSSLSLLPTYEAVSYEPISDQAARIMRYALKKERDNLINIGMKLHQYPETAFQERYARDLLSGFMKNKDWIVEKSICGLETSWKATFRHGEGGRTVGFNAEMDALPGIGHACGHNLIAEGAIAAALGLAAAMKEMDISGKVILIGTPAEESGGGKITLLKRGAYEDASAMLMIHPGGGAPYKADILSPMLAIDSFSKYVYPYRHSVDKQIDVEFFGRAAHAALAPDQGINALDAAVLAYSNVNALRQQIKSYERVHGVIEGQNYATNVIPDYSKLKYGVRSGTLAELIDLKRRTIACMKAAAQATGCRIVIHDSTPPHPELHHNGHLAYEYANIMQRNFSTKVQLSLDTPGGASTDFGAITYAMPALHPAYEIYSEKGVSNHSPGFTGATDKPIAHEKTIEAAMGISLTAFRVLSDEEFAHVVESEYDHWVRQLDKRL